MKRYLTALFVAIALLVSFVAPTAFALEVPPKPKVPIVDQAHVLSAEQVANLSQKIEKEATETSNQIGVLTVSSLQGEALEEYALNVARTWGIGTKDKNNGVLLFIAVKDRQVRIEVGYGLEGALPDAQAHRIITNDITPSFKQGNYYQGISNGLDGIIKSIHGEYQGSAPISRQETSSDGGVWGYIASVGFIVFTWLTAILGRSKSWWAGGIAGGVFGVTAALFVNTVLASWLLIGGFAFLGLLLDFSVSRNYKKNRSRGSSPSWWAGGGGFSGGGSGGFSGGSFGGGGSSGSW